MKKEIDDEYINLLNENKKLIEELEKEEINTNRISTVDSEINKIKTERNSTNIQKERFINEITSGLGKSIKENPNKVTIIKKKWYYKIKKFFIKIIEVL